MWGQIPEGKVSRPQACLALRQAPGGLAQGSSWERPHSPSSSEPILETPLENLCPGRSQSPCPAAPERPREGQGLACSHSASLIPLATAGPKDSPRHADRTASPAWKCSTGEGWQRSLPGRQQEPPSQPADLAAGTGLNGRHCEVREGRAWREQRLKLQGLLLRILAQA